jgi:hypothetical protein
MKYLGLVLIAVSLLICATDLILFTNIIGWDNFRDFGGITFQSRNATKHVSPALFHCLVGSVCSLGVILGVVLLMADRKAE